MCLLRTELRPSARSCLAMLEKPRGWLRLGSIGCHRSRVGEGLQIARMERYMEQRQILESREVLQLSCGTNNLKKQKSEVSSRLIDRMLSRSGFSAPNSTHSCHEGAGRKFGGHLRVNVDESFSWIWVIQSSTWIMKWIGSKVGALFRPVTGIMGGRRGGWRGWRPGRWGWECFGNRPKAKEIDRWNQV